MKWRGVCFLSLFAGYASGAGFQLYTEGSAEALGQAAAISGRTNLVSLAWYNPSALAGTGQAQVMAGAVFASIRTDFNSDTGPAADSSMTDDWRVIPHFYAVQPLDENWTATLSVNAPFGLITEWPDGWAGSVVAVYSELSTVYTTPSLVYRVHEELSVSAGLNVVYAEARLTANRDLSVLSLPNLGNRTIEGDDLALGYTVSGHAQSGDWGLGLRFQSRVKLRPEGTVRYDNDPGFGREFRAEGSADLPASVNFGIVNGSMNNITVGFEVVWTEWRAYDELIFTFPDNPYETSPEVNPKLWRNVFSFRFGADYALNDTWSLRAGYVFDESPVNKFTLAPELPGSDRHMLMVGLGWKHRHIGIDAAYSYLHADGSRTGSGVVNANPPLSLGAAGKYNAMAHLFGLSVSYRF
ncbi:MAG TPA: outer membrane protein transport protein [Pontiella sp.]